MYTIKKNITNEIVIKNSKFIAMLIKVNTENEIKDILYNIKIEYKDATHYCYAYIVDNIKRFNDDGEPSGTAGMPILNVLEKNNLNYILCVVIRYFGGIKLGAGGLVRAYTKATTECLNKTVLEEYIKTYHIKIEFSINNLKIIDNILNNINITNKLFSNNVIYEFIIKDDEKAIMEELKKIVITLEVN